FYGVIGLALGFGSPAKNSLFSTNVNEEKSTFIFGILDAAVFLSMAIAAVVGGLIAEKFGFQVLFFLAAGLNLAAIVPYLLYIKYWRTAGSLQGFGISQFSPYHTVTE